MPFCSSCGKSIPTSANFCSICGAGQTSMQTTSSATQNSKKIVSASIRQAISKTLFVVPQVILKSFNELLEKNGTPPFRIVSDADPATIQNRARDLLKKNASNIKFICIIGLWSDVPPFEIENPAHSWQDIDSHCLTDAPYGCIEDVSDAYSCVPDIPVGRIPSTNLSIISEALFIPPAKNELADLFMFGVTALCWSEATDCIISRFLDQRSKNKMIQAPVSKLIDSEISILTSPGWSDDELGEAVKKTGLKDSAVILFNVHGGPDDTGWVGEDLDRNYVPIFKPGTIDRFNSAVMFTEACYGGAMGYDSQSVVEHFFENGGKAFVGCSVIAYGSPSSNISGADVLALNFLLSLKNGSNLGEALTKGKLEVLVDDPMCSEVSAKTVMSFNLFGAPWHQLKESPTSRADLPSVRGESALDRIRNRMKSSEDSDQLSKLGSIRQQYQSRLPQARKKFLLTKQEVLTQLNQFKNNAEISNELERWGASIDDIEMQYLSFDSVEGFQLIGHSKNGNSDNIVILITDKLGNLQKTLTSKSGS